MSCTYFDLQIFPLDKIKVLHAKELLSFYPRLLVIHIFVTLLTKGVEVVTTPYELQAKSPYGVFSLQSPLNIYTK